jgi:hypothetical protein
LAESLTPPLSGWARSPTAAATPAILRPSSSSSSSSSSDRDRQPRERRLRPTDRPSSSPPPHQHQLLVWASQGLTAGYHPFAVRYSYPYHHRTRLVDFIAHALQRQGIP